MASWSDVPKDVIRLWLNEYVTPQDYLNLLLAHRVFHVLTVKDRSSKYRELMIERAMHRDFVDRARKQLGYKKFKTVEELCEHFVACPYCPAIVKKANYNRHVTRKCQPDDLQRLRVTVPIELNKVRCRGLSCSFTTQRWDMWRHVSECPYQMMQCNGCGEEKTRLEMVKEGHQWFECWDQHNFACKWGCGKKRIGSSRGEWAQHLKKCAVEEVECPLCHRMVQRQFLKYHQLKQPPPAFNDLGFNRFSAPNQPSVFNMWRVDDRAELATCADKSSGAWHRWPAAAWGRSGITCVRVRKM
uniref:TRAF-type domain-containing protein n=1 Tax=viral metagenome TaxID=1070528 RepID=A0A6C0BPQ7_9ZZZZ